MQKVISQSEEKTGQKALTGFSLSQHLKRGWIMLLTAFKKVRSDRNVIKYFLWAVTIKKASPLIFLTEVRYLR